MGLFLGVNEEAEVEDDLWAFHLLYLKTDRYEILDGRAEMPRRGAVVFSIVNILKPTKETETSRCK